MALWAQFPSERPVRFVVPPVWELRLRVLRGSEDGVAHKHGDHAIALRGVIFTHPVPQVRSPNAFANRRLLFLRICILANE